MDPANGLQMKSGYHALAVPFPGRGHVNPMISLCKLLISKKHDILVTFIVTEEWLGFISPYCKSNSNIRFSSIPNVIPSELDRGVEFSRFYEAVMTKMEGPFEHVLDNIQQPVNVIIADFELPWAIRIGNKKKIPVASLCTVSATVFSIFQYFFHSQNMRILSNLLDNRDDVEQIQGNSSQHVAQLLAMFQHIDPREVQQGLEGISLVQKAQYLLFNSIYELESEVLNTLKGKFNFPIYPIGPAIPYFELKEYSPVPTSPNTPDYTQWLDSQSTGSVLYVSFGSFHIIPNDQMEEIAAGLRNSGVRYLWVARGDTFRFKENCGDKGLVVPWCDQLKVLCHSSIGGFWTHCGWNSTLEAIFAGIPMLTFPLCFDQGPNSNQIVESWGIGWKVEQEAKVKNLVTRDEITELVQTFMDNESGEGKDLRRRAKELKEICRRTIDKGGSADKNIEAFIRDVFHL